MKKLFANKEVNRGRQDELDVARGLAIFFMIAVHVLGRFSTQNIIDSYFGKVVCFFGSIPAAPVFMFLLGVGLVYSRTNNPNKMIKRGLIILVSGYILNITYGSAPAIIQYFITGDISNICLAIDLLIEVDVLVFSGLSLIFFGVLKYFKVNKKTILILAIFISIINSLIPKIEFTNVFMKAFTGVIWGTSEVAMFPFLSWIIFPILGYIWGLYLIRCVNKERFYKLNLINSIWIFGLYFYILSRYLDIDLLLKDRFSYFHNNIILGILFICLLIFWISIIYFITKFIPKRLITTFKRWSKNVTKIYFIHWLFIGWLGLLIKNNTQGLISTTILFIVIMILSDYLASYFKKFNI